MNCWHRRRHIDFRRARPWSNAKMRELGKRIASGQSLAGAEPEYRDVVVWYDDLADTVRTKIAEFDWESLLGHEDFEVTARAKTIDTLREKLNKDPNTPLQSIQDFAGVRFEADVDLLQQDAIAEPIAKASITIRRCVLGTCELPHTVAIGPCMCGFAFPVSVSWRFRCELSYKANGQTCMNTLRT